MKTKRFSEKLMLNKKTIANLNDEQMVGIRGGKLPIVDYTTKCDGGGGGGGGTETLSCPTQTCE
jgi:hypothetical protein